MGSYSFYVYDKNYSEEKDQKSEASEASEEGNIEEVEILLELDLSFLSSNLSF